MGLKAANLGLRFFLELAAVAALGYWGWETGGWPLAAAAVAAAVVVWGLYVAPKARYDLAHALRFAVEAVVWAAAAAALVATDHVWLGIAFFVVAVLSGLLNYRWHT